MTRPIATVTGGGSGIGAAIATTLGERGYHVVVTDQDLASAQATASKIESAEALGLDVTDPAACDATVNTVVAQHGRLDVWVSNAGISKMQRFVDISPSDLTRNFEVNTYGVFYCGQSAARAMIALATPGRIINTASMASKQGRVPYLADYVASKFAVLGLTRTHRSRDSRRPRTWRGSWHSSRAKTPPSLPVKQSRSTAAPTWTDRRLSRARPSNDSSRPARVP